LRTKCGNKAENGHGGQKKMVKRTKNGPTYKKWSSGRSLTAKVKKSLAENATFWHLCSFSGRQGFLSKNPRSA